MPACLIKVLTLYVPEHKGMFPSATVQERLPRQQKIFKQRCSPLYSTADKEFNLRTLKDLYKIKNVDCRKTNLVWLFGCNVAYFVKEIFGETPKYLSLMQKTDI